MTINEVQDNIIDEFSLFDDWMDKYNLLIDMGKTCQLSIRNSR
jgi:cysteine desulfuration protein SufE